MEKSEVLIKKARLAQESDQHEDMFLFLKEYLGLKPELGSDERNQFSNAAKHVLGSQRAAWRFLKGIIKSSAERGDDTSIAEDYLATLAGRITDRCQEVIVLLEPYFVSEASTYEEFEAQTIYRRMQADSYSYQAEVATGNMSVELAQKADAVYNNALAISEKLEATHPIRLEFALNRSIFLYQIKNNPEDAYNFISTVFNNALEDFTGIKEEFHKKSAFLMTEIRSVLELWSANSAQDSE
jgi:stratifin